MTHPGSGELRRAIDEPGHAPEVLAHASECDQCGTELERLRADAGFCAAALEGAVAPDAESAYRRVHSRAIQPAAFANFARPAAALAAAAAIVLALVLTPLGGYARSFLTVFEPKQFEAVQVSRADLRHLRILPQAEEVGTQRIVTKMTHTRYVSFASAQKHAGFAVRRPGVLPAGFGTVHDYMTMTPSEMTFTFNAAKARAFEKRSHKTLPPMPPGLDGTTVRVRTGYALESSFQSRASKEQSLVIVQAQAPRVTSTGASLDTLERYLLSMPNVSPELARRIRALGDIQNTVPVPVIIDKQTARQVQVDGAQGLAIGDNTGLGAGVMWQKNGIVYVVAGPLKMDQVLEVANGLR